MLNNPEICIGEWSAYLSVQCDVKCITFCHGYKKIAVCSLFEIMDDAYTAYTVCNTDQVIKDRDGTEHTIPARVMRIIVQFIKEFSNDI